MTSPPGITRDSSIAALIPHYRCEQWLAQCLRSLVEQTRVPDAIVVIDDASDSPPVEIVRAFPSVTLFRARENVGPYRLIQQVMEETAFDGYMFQDADDWSGPRRLELLLLEAERTGAALIGCQEMMIMTDGSDPRPRFYTPEVREQALARPRVYPVLHPSSIVARELVMRLGGYATGLRFGGDSEFLRRAIWVAKVTNAPYLGYFRRIRPGALTTAPETAVWSPARIQHREVLARRQRKTIEAHEKGEPLDLSPLVTAPPVELRHLCGPSLDELRRTGTGRTVGARPAASDGATVAESEPADPDPTPVFIMGPPGSGAGLVHASLAQHPKLLPVTSVAWLIGYVNRQGDTLKFPAPRSPNASATASDSVGAAKGTWIDGSPLCWSEFRQLIDQVPEMRAILVLPAGTEVTPIENALGSSRVRRIEAETLRAHPEATIRGLLDLLGVAFSSACIRPLLEHSVFLSESA